MMYGDGFGDGFGAIFALVFIIIIGTIIFKAVKGVNEWSMNNNSPIQTIAATVVGKRVKRTTDANGHTSKTYFVTFEVQSGARSEFRISSREYKQLTERDFGNLTHQGTRFHSFERHTVYTVEVQAPAAPASVNCPGCGARTLPGETCKYCNSLV